ncbi:carbonic anhydrase 4-like [Eucyclogobius newberryi]|uniref:carbonic anhydrase 4-like n=1 Tax=Eucyclogobius newberryi TaxID=166745 RepID=UPI003B5920C6
MDEGLGNFTFVNFSSRGVFENMMFTEYTVKLNLKENMVEFHGGGLNGTYAPIHFLFHWGDTEHHPGSEHLLDNKRFRMEMQLVSLKKGYTMALAKPEGIAVLAFFIQEMENMNNSEAWTNLTSHIGPSGKVNLTDAISIHDLIGHVDLTKYYRYNGSLTSPLCNEKVLWTVFEEPLYVNADLLQLFPLKTQKTNVFRPMQELKGRQVYASPAVHLPSAHHWCYDEHECDYGPEKWHALAGSYCAGSRQSPLDISSKDAMVDKLLDAFHFTHFDDKHAIDYVINTGHSVKCVLKDGLVEVSGGGLGHVYSVLQFHFHWANNASDSKGSEHLLDSKRFPMEMHIVTKRKDLTLEEALKNGNGLAVLGFFIEVRQNLPWPCYVLRNQIMLNKEPNPSSNTEAWKHLTSYLKDIKKTDTKANFSAEVSLDDLLGDVNRGSYYRYNGSLTTPSCNEAVVWTVFKHTVKVDPSLMHLFPTTIGFHDVFRPAQDLHKRIIYTSAAAATQQPTLLVLLMLTSANAVLSN